MLKKFLQPPSFFFSLRQIYGSNSIVHKIYVVLIEVGETKDILQIFLLEIFFLRSDLPGLQIVLLFRDSIEKKRTNWVKGRDDYIYFYLQDDLKGFSIIRFQSYGNGLPRRSGRMNPSSVLSTLMKMVNREGERSMDFGQKQTLIL